MKKSLNYYLSMTFIASLFVMAGCGTEEDPIVDAPAVTATALDNTTTVDVGEAVSFTVNVTAPGGFNNLIVNQTVGSEATVKFDQESKDPGTTPTTYSYDFTFVPGPELAGETIVFDFVAVDDVVDESGFGREGKYTHTVVVNAAQVVSSPVASLIAPASDGSTETFFSTTTLNETYSSDEVTGTAAAISPLIDFGYFYGTSFGATIAAPADFPTAAGQADWNVRNNTMLKLTNLDLSAFNESTATIINNAYEAADFGANDGQVRNLAVGDVIVFETDPTKAGGSKRGLIYVQEIDPGTTNIDFIKILVKVIE